MSRRLQECSCCRAWTNGRKVSAGSSPRRRRLAYSLPRDVCVILTHSSQLTMLCQWERARPPLKQQAEYTKSLLGFVICVRWFTGAQLRYPQEDSPQRSPDLTALARSLRNHAERSVRRLRLTVAGHDDWRVGLTIQVEHLTPVRTVPSQHPRQDQFPDTPRRRHQRNARQWQALLPSAGCAPRRVGAQYPDAQSATVSPLPRRLSPR